MRLILVRHPQTEANVKKLIYGRTESNYSKEGEATIPGIVEALHRAEVDVIISSPLKRTRYLAQQIAKDHGYDEALIQIDDRVAEMHFGVLENLTIERAKEEHKEIYEGLLANYEEYVLPGGESFTMVYDRVKDFLQELYDRYEAGRDTRQTELNAWEECTGDVEECLPQKCDPEKTVVVVAHSMVIHGALAYLLNMDLKDIWHIKTEPGAIVDLDYRCDFAMLQGLSGPFNIRKTEK